MSRKSSSRKSNQSKISETSKAFIARRIIDVMALISISFSVFIALSMASYDKKDPSLNSASDSEAVNNIFGVKGAYISDFLIQSVGYGGYILAFIFAVWGVRIYLRHSLRPLWLRFSSLLISMVFASVAFAKIPSSALPSPYSGGSGGSLILNLAGGALHNVFGGWEYVIISIISAFASIFALSIACAINKYEAKTAFLWSFYFIKSLYAFIYNSTQSFIDWVHHYGNHEYIPRKKQVKVVPPKIQEDRKVTAPSPANEILKEDSPNNKSIKVVNPQNIEKTSSILSQGSFSLSSGEEWQFPPIDLLDSPPEQCEKSAIDEASLRKNAHMLHTVLQDFNVKGDIVSIHPGPVVTLYELEPAPGVKSSRVIGLSDDIARSMSAISVRAAVVPGRNVIGIELPNKARQTVFMRELLLTKDYMETKAKLPLVLGKDIGGKPIIGDLARMPHLLVAGTTGSGKSVAVNTMILSLLYKLPPEKCRFLMIDPKMLELSIYDDIPHLLAPVVTDPAKAVVSLKWVVQEMENRYSAMSKLGVRNIEGYNQRMADAVKKGETLMRKVQTGFDVETGKPVYEEQALDLSELPYIVVVVDEFADLMMVAGKDVESAIQRLAQMARAAGIHIIMATQRPSVDVITGVIKANFPTRISFQVTSKIDSRTILGEGGAEQLLGMGDMLYMAGGGKIKRVHGPFTSDDSVRDIVEFLKIQGEPSYLDEITEGSIDSNGGGVEGFESGNKDMDEFYDAAVALVAREGKASTSFIQRYFKIGYNRAANIIEEMERQGVIGPANHVGKREVLVSDHSDVA